MKPCNVYAFSLIVYEIMTLEEPFKNLDLPMLYTKVIIQNYRPEFEYPIANCYKELNTKCWSGNPEERPTFDEIVDILKNNEEFITENVDENEYFQYIDYIKEYKKSFDKKKKIISISDFMISKSITLKTIDVDFEKTSQMKESKHKSDSKNTKIKKSDNSLTKSKKIDKKSSASIPKHNETEIIDDNKSIRRKSISTVQQKVHEKEYIEEHDSTEQNSSSDEENDEKNDDDDSTNIERRTKLSPSKTLPNTIKLNVESDKEHEISKTSIFKSNKNPKKEKSKRFSLFKKSKSQKTLITLPNDECNSILREAENDAEKQFFIAKSFIEEKNNFPLDIENGISYLKRSIKGGCIDAVVYYCQMLIKGINIPKNLDKAKKTLKKHLKSKNSSILFLYGKVKKKEGDNKTTAKYFKKSSDEGNPKAMYNLAKLLFTDNKYNIHQSNVNALTYFNMAKNNGYDKYDSFLSKQSADSIYQFGN